MLLTTLDELNINHRKWNVHRISQSGFCSVGIACDSQRFHSSQYNALHWRSNPDVCWVLEKARFRLGTWHRLLWWGSLSAETSCQRGGWILQHHRALNWEWTTGLAWGNSSLCVAAVQIIIPAFCTLKQLKLPRSESFGSIFPSALLSTQRWAVTAREPRRSASWAGTRVIKQFSSGGSGLSPCPPPNPIQLVNTLNKS